MMSSIRRQLLRFALALALLVLPQSAMAQSTPHATAQSGSFTILALITADPDWVKEWSRTDGQPPRLVPASTVTVGDVAQVLVMFEGAAEQGGRLLVACEVSVTTPDGQVHALPTSRCFDRPLDGPASASRLLDVDMGLNVEPTDPLGLYRFAIRATDLFSGETVATEISVEVVARGGT
jgi:hypothetical protein